MRARIADKVHTTYQYEVIVGNIGTVYKGPSVVEARKMFDYYIEQSRGGYGRAAGESVTLLLNGEIRREYVGSSVEETRRRRTATRRPIRRR
jgi:hypothetical protein